MHPAPDEKGIEIGHCHSSSSSSSDDDDDGGDDIDHDGGFQCHIDSLVILCLALSYRTNNLNDLARVRPWPDLILMQSIMTSPNDLSTRIFEYVERLNM